MTSSGRVASGKQAYDAKQKAIRENRRAVLEAIKTRKEGENLRRAMQG